MQKIQISYRNERGHIKFVDPLAVPEDAPAEIKAAAAAVAGLLMYGPPVPVERPLLVAQSMETPCVGEGQPKRRRGRPAGYKCNEETKDRMRAAKLAMWQQIKATMSEIDPNNWSN